MIGGGLALRYVKALFELAQEKGVVENISADLQVLDETIAGSPELGTFLNNPSVDRSAKKGAVCKLFPDASSYTVNFMRIVIDKNRTEIFTVVYRLFQELVNKAHGVVTGTIHSAVPLDKETFAKVREQLEIQFKRKLVLRTEIDPEIIGGLRIQVGNTVIDNSLKGRLNNLKKVLTGA